MESTTAGTSAMQDHRKSHHISKRRRLSDTQAQIAERREQVWLLLVKNLSEKEIAQVVGTSQATISGDVKALQEEARNSLSELCERTLPFYYERCLRGIEEIKRESWLLFHDAKDFNEKLRALREIRESEMQSYQLFRDGPSALAVAKSGEEVERLFKETEDWRKEREEQQRRQRYPS
jgi:hypothetical protein